MSAQPEVGTAARGTDRRRLGGQAARFAVVGAASTVLHLGLFALLDLWWSAPQPANLVALTLATVANTSVNRAWTFGVTGRAELVRHQVQGFVLFLVTWGATAAGLALLHRVAPDAGTLANVAALGVSTGAAMVIRFLAMRSWIFRVA